MVPVADGVHTALAPTPDVTTVPVLLVGLRNGVGSNEGIRCHGH